MSGSGKKVADLAVKAGKAIDWDGMAKMLVSEEARKEFATLRRTFEDVNHQLQTKFSQEPQPIDWEYYRKGIGSKVVDMYKEAYESIEIPKYVDTVTPEYKPKFDALVVELKEAEQASLKESERIEKEIAELKEMKKKISTMTADEYFAKHPELKQKFDDEIREIRHLKSGGFRDMCMGLGGMPTESTVSSFVEIPSKHILFDLTIFSRIVSFLTKIMLCP
ncbi:ATP synthase subunit d, mitochondrial [Dichanthelium oligosanthes]|uniref:ATP synthase subunit d, mitochondrial n=1 Tax=Dichanthelium oligosanthes TaxID=888268 RepID=A0A1E5VFW9_9POAL|nr:ATP synthase subunit d, mitochondrial [Dichanthelium oligosanthes]